MEEGEAYSSTRLSAGVRSTSQGAGTVAGTERAAPPPAAMGGAGGETLMAAFAASCMDWMRGTVAVSRPAWMVIVSGTGAGRVGARMAGALPERGGGPVSLL